MKVWSMVITPTCVCLALMAAPLHSALAQDDDKSELITYLFEDFESYTPGCWRGRPEVRGDREAETENVRSGRRAVEVWWDFTKCPDASMSFANFVFHRRTIGRVQEVRVWLFASEEVKETPVVLWINDPSREIYLQRARVDWTGWKQVRFRVAGVGPAWKSGDGNNQQDTPLSVFGLAVDYGGPNRGKLIMDDMEVVTLATPREALGFSPSTEAYKNLFWDEQPILHLSARNHSSKAVRGVRCQLQAEDLYHKREAWSAQVDYKEIPPSSVVERSRKLNVPYGVYRIHWKLVDDNGELLNGSLDVSRMTPPCYRDAPAAVRDYDRRWSIFGGVFGYLTPQLASDMGARWIRYEKTVWSSYEEEPGRFEMDRVIQAMKPYKDAGIEAIILQTLYQRPAFRNPEQVDFARSYGEVMRRTAQAARGLARCFELGNEDNGPTKALYSEVARHGAAGIRSVRPHALIANSGTAFVDLGWLKLQASRGVMDWLDALCTHPYTVNESAEAWDVFGRLEQVNDLIDTLGGMKVQWTTEFGWHHTFSQRRRAEWTPRHFLIGAAAGLERHGLYTWERDYGIFQGTAQPPAASVHALAKMLEGHRFVGLLHRSDELWACVWERAGRPLAIAWSPAGRAEWSVDVEDDARAFDLFGNQLAAHPQKGRLTLHLNGGPVYVTGVTSSVLEKASQNQCAREHARLVKCWKSAGLPEGSIWARLAANSQASSADLRDALVSWKPTSRPIKPPEQAVIAQALRWYSTAARYSDVPVELTPREELAARRRKFRNRLATLVSHDVDLPSLRYLLERWDRLDDEVKMARELGADKYARRLLTVQETVSVLCERFAAYGERKLFSLWPYLYTLKDDGALEETLHFVPGESAAVKVRVNSYSPTDHEVSVSLRLPDGWKLEPDPLRLTARAGLGAEAELRVYCPADVPSEKPVLECVLQADGLPEGVVAFDDVVIEAPVQLTVEPLPGLLPQTPLRAALSNPGARPLSGLLRLMRKGDTRAIARVELEDLSAEKPLPLEFKLVRVPPLPYHDWPLIAQFILKDGRRLERPIVVDFACAVRAKVAPRIDGDLKDWTNAAPLHLNREEYTKGSFGGKWSPDDLSATTYAMWDDEFLYFAAQVIDQTFNQTLSGRSIWIQDSIQFSLARDADSPRTEIGLALTAKGEEVVNWTAPTAATPGARLKVNLQQSGAIYEAAVPWRQIKGIEEPTAGLKIRYAVLVNDDDAVTGRRFIERYGGIAHDKDIGKFGYLTLLPDWGEGTAAKADDLVFVEDFEEYNDGELPDAWEAVRHKPPFPEAKVAAGMGRNGSKGLVLFNSIGQKPYVYLIFVRPLSAVRPGERYELRCWVRGRGVEAASGIIGVCSDKWGNEAFSYAKHGTIGDEWKEVVHQFSGPPGGPLNVIIRNHAKMDELVIDDLRVTRIE